MHIWTHLITREAVFLLALLALGAGPAAFISPRVDKVSRLALAPSLGLCVGVCVTNTLAQWEPVQSTYWVVIVLAILSLSAAAWRIIRNQVRFALPLRELAQIGLIAVAVLGPASSALRQSESVGPVGLNVYDAAGYVAEIDSLQTRSIAAASASPPPYQDLRQEYWSNYARAYQNVDATPLEGSLNDVLGLHATDTQSPFLIALLFVAALGAFVAYRYVTRSRGWPAVLAGAVYGGSFFLQLWADSSQAAICGLALLLPFLVLGAQALRERRTANTVLVALVAAGLLSVYPLFVPQAALGSVIILAWLMIREVRRRLPTRRQGLSALGHIALTAGLAAGLSPIAFGRDLRYWQAILQGKLSFSSLPVYHLPVGVLPGWILQTREFYYLPAIGRGGLKQLLLAVLLPVIMLAVIGFGLRWQRRAAVLLPFAASCALLAEYVSIKDGCEYCAQRNLLPLGPMAAVLLALGVGALFASRTTPGRVIGIAAAIIIVGAVGERMRVERQRIIDTAYLLDSSVRGVLAHLPRGTGSVEVEGFGATVRGPAEMPFVYDLVNERSNGHASIAIESTDYSSFAYLGPPPQPAAFDPNYRYVLTRFAGLNAGRRLIARSGGIALEERAQPLDVTPVAGLGVPEARLNPGGLVWIQGGLLPGPLLFFVTGGTRTAPVWVRLDLATEEALGVPHQPGVRSSQSGGRLTVCIRARGSGPVRRASLSLSFRPIAGPEPHQLFTLPQPAEGVELLGMTAATHDCIP